MRFTPRRLAAACLAAAALALAACAVNPATGRRQFMLMSESQEISMGRQADAEIVQTYGLYDDPKLAAYVDSVGQRMALLSDRPGLEFTFRVLDSPVINAFALPGGYVYITRGILAHMNDEAELAMVIGHEIGHVTARHGAEQYTKQQLAGLGLGLGSLFVPQVARFGQLAETALGLLFLKYSRDDESQADELGVRYATRAGFDPTEGVSFFHVLDRMSQESGQSLPSWLSTHPAPGDRVQRTAELARAAKEEHPDASRVGAGAHLARVDGVVFGDDPRQGFVEGGLFKHPELRFQIEFPSGWKVQNTPGAVTAGEPRQQAVMQLTMEKSDGLGPHQYATRVATSAGATIAEGSAEDIHGAEAYVALLQVPSDAGSTTPVLAAFVRRKPGGPIYQVVAQAAQGAFRTYRDDFLRSMRSLRDLTDPQALAMEPNRVAVQTIRSRTTLALAVGQATSPVRASVVALLNDLQPESSLAAGSKLKLVRGTYRPPGDVGGGS